MTVFRQNVRTTVPVWMASILINVCVQVDILAKTAKQVRRNIWDFLNMPYFFNYDCKCVEIIEYFV